MFFVLFLLVLFFGVVCVVVVVVVALQCPDQTKVYVQLQLHCFQSICSIGLSLAQSSVLLRLVQTL